MTNCKTFFGQDDNFFQERSCINTATEIASQPLIWKELAKLLSEKKQYICDFMESLGDLSKLRIILTGAGSSAFIGEAVASFAGKSSGLKCEAIHTTDIVSAPNSVLFSDIPTLLVSFARSGNSPESVGAVEYARKKIKTLHEAAIICDGSSKLSNVTKENKSSFILLMPEGSNDKGFAMTSSVSCMMLAAFALLNYRKLDEIVNDINSLSENLANNSRNITEVALKLAKKSFDRAVYLGSGGFKGITHEASLKMMELTNGIVNSSFDSATGFRHGPKTVIKDNTISLHFISNDPFTAKYDIDLLLELFNEKNKNMVAAICNEKNDALKADDIVVLGAGSQGIAKDICSGIMGLVFFQTFAMYKSLELGITTDNPSPGGQVNRVVKGVTVYPYAE